MSGWIGGQLTGRSGEAEERPGPDVAGSLVNQPGDLPTRSLSISVGPLWVRLNKRSLAGADPPRGKGFSTDQGLTWGGTSNPRTSGKPNPLLAIQTNRKAPPGGLALKIGGPVLYQP